MWYWQNGLCEEKQIKNRGHTFLAGQADLNQCTWKRGPKPLKKPKGEANLQSSQKVSISCGCKTKLGYILLFLENASSLQDHATEPELPYSAIRILICSQITQSSEIPFLDTNGLGCHTLYLHPLGLFIFCKVLGWWDWGGNMKKKKISRGGAIPTK